MSLTKAVQRAHLMLDKISCLPYCTDSKSAAKLLTFNPEYNKTAHKIVRFVTQAFNMYCGFFLATRLIWLKLHWNSFAIYNLDQPIGCAIILSYHLIVEVVYDIYRRQHRRLIFLTNQTNQIFRENADTNVKSQSRISIKQAFVYHICLGFLMFPPAMFFGPFAIDWCPNQLLFGRSLLVKFLSGIHYSGIIFVNEVPVLSVLMLLSAFLENVCSITSSLLNSGPYSSFRQNYSKFCTAHILIWLCSEVYQLFFISLAFVAVLFSCCSAFVLLKLYHKLNIIVYGGAVALLILCLSLTIVLSYLCSIPRRNIMDFINHWFKVSRKRIDRKILKSCRPIGFLVGPYGVVTKKMGLCICDDMVRNTVTLLLLDIS